jgi:hypothetical protein
MEHISTRQSISDAATLHHRLGDEIANEQLVVPGVEKRTYGDVFRSAWSTSYKSETRIWHAPLRSSEKPIVHENGGLRFKLQALPLDRDERQHEYVEVCARMDEWSDRQRDLFVAHVLKVSKDARWGGGRRPAAPIAYVLAERDAAKPALLEFDDPRKFAFVPAAL